MNNDEHWKVGNSRRFYKPLNSERTKKEIKLECEKGALEKINKCRQIIRKDTINKIQDIIGEVVKSIQEDDTVDRYYALSLVLALGIQSQIAEYDEMLKAEKEKKHPNIQIITYAREKKDKLLLDGFKELRKMNDSEHNARYGKKNLNLNLNADVKKINYEDWIKGGDK